jgi:predicted dehydrogenase
MSAQPAFDAQPSSEVRLGFVGLGWIGRKRLDALAADVGVQVVAIADADRERLQSAAQAYPDAIATESFDAVLDRRMDGIVIATPNGAHASQAVACLERGISVFCQKPLATNAADAQRIVTAARCADRLLEVDYCYRHVQGMSELRQRILGGELGEIASIDLKFHNAYAPNKAWCRDRRQSGGGCLLDLGVHLLDLASWLQGAPLTKLVSSQLFAAGRPIQGDTDAIEDHACAELLQANGTVVRLSCSWNAHIGCDAEIGVELRGSKGGAAWRNFGGSFYDFTLDVFHGTQAQRIGSHPDDWGARALQAWVARLRKDPSFDPASLQFQHTAALLDEIYAR